MEQLQTAINRYETCLPTKRRHMMRILVRALGPANEEMKKQERKLQRSWEMLESRGRGIKADLPEYCICEEVG